MSSTPEAARERLCAVALCAEDSALALAARTLAGGEVVRCANPYRAVAECAQENADIILIDLDALREEEMEVVAVLRELCPAAHIVVAFSLIAREKAVRALTAGADAYLIQPFYPAEFRAIWEAAVAAVRARRAGQEPPGDALRLMRPLADWIADRLSQPLTPLSGFLEMMASEPSRSPEDARQLRERLAEARRIGEIVNLLREFAAQRPGVALPVRVDEVLAELSEEARRAAATNGAQVEMDLRASGATTLGDEAQLRWAWRRLLHSRRAALPERGCLRLESRSGPDYVEVRIVDNGPPLAADGLDPARPDPRNPDWFEYLVCDYIMRSHGGWLRWGRSAMGGGNELIAHLPAAGKRKEG